MNGLLTALLGGAAGAGQGMQYQDEKARALAQLKLAQDAQNLERSKLQADLFMQGLTPADASTGAPPMITSPAPDNPQGSAPLSSVAAPTMPRIRQRDGFVSPPAQPGPSVGMPATAPTPSPVASSSPGGLPFSLDRYMANDGQRLNLPGMGAYQYDFSRSPLARQAIMDAIKTHMTTDEGIRKDNATGVTAKNQHEATRLQPGDPGYVATMGQVAGAEAKGRLPAEVALENVRASVQRALQDNQHQFELGKMTQEQKFTADQTALRMAGEWANAMGIKQWEEGGSPVARTTRGLMGASAPPIAPSTAVAPLPLTPEQIQRAKVNPAYRAFLESQGYRSF